MMCIFDFIIKSKYYIGTDDVIYVIDFNINIVVGVSCK